METAHQKSLARPEVNRLCRDRIAKLDPETVPLWGTMTAAQMMAHCGEVLEVAGGRELRGSPWYFKLLMPLVRRVVMGRKPFAHGMQTHPQYRQVEKRDFEREKVRLLAAVAAFEHLCADATHVEHPFFGKMTVADMGWGMYKHLDHHLKQFGI